MGQTLDQFNTKSRIWTKIFTKTKAISMPYVIKYSICLCLIEKIIVFVKMKQIGAQSMQSVTCWCAEFINRSTRCLNCVETVATAHNPYTLICINSSDASGVFAYWFCEIKGKLHKVTEILRIWRLRCFLQGFGGPRLCSYMRFNASSSHHHARAMNIEVNIL